MSTRLMPVGAWFKEKMGWSEEKIQTLYISNPMKGAPSIKWQNEETDKTEKVPLPDGTALILIPDMLVPEMWEDYVLDMSEEEGTWFIGLEADVRGAKAYLGGLDVLMTS